MEPDALLQRLTTAVQRRFGAAAAVADLKALSGGASAETCSFDVIVGAQSRPLIMQRMAGAQQFEASLDRALQAAVQKTAYDSKVPVAEVAFVLDDTDGLGNGYAMQRIEGETLGPRILKGAEFATARSVMTQQCGKILACIHNVDMATLPPLPRRTGADSLKAMESIYRKCGVDLPVFELALQWLSDHVPTLPVETLVHGDFRLGNLIVGPEGIRAVLDWEMAHIGDPMEDFGWLSVPSWRYGQLANDVGGFGRMVDAFAAYKIANGKAINTDSLKFWQILGTLKWGLVCLFFAFQHINGDVRSVERASIGRRTSETELDLLVLMREA
ncbi:MAG: phosphotransferase family protein [Rhodospirillaceae bacterium]|nr:phosphotransferase family protein [Rhodospirillaceae bacterium]